MPLLLIGSGLALILVGLNGDPGKLYSLLANDVSGFVYWFVAIVVLGAMGYVPGLEKFSKLFLILVIIALLLTPSKTTNEAAGVTFIKGIQQFFQQVNQGANQPSTSTQG